MDDNEKTLILDEYKKLKEQLLKEMDNQNNTFDSNGQSSNKIKSYNNGHYKENKDIFDYYLDKKSGMVNVLMLSIITFIFECIFLFLSFMIYK